jgi:hypothetical protein
LLILLQSLLLLQIRYIFYFIFLIFISINNIYLQPLSIVDSKEFRNLLLLLKEDLQNKDIPHRTTITKRILELNQEHIDHLSNQMVVSLFTLIIVLS